MRDAAYRWMMGLKLDYSGWTPGKHPLFLIAYMLCSPTTHFQAEQWEEMQTELGRRGAQRCQMPH